MIAVDFSQTFISNFMSNLDYGSKEPVPIEEDLLRHMIVNAIRGYRQKFGAEYGELVICVDSRKNWRKDFFEHYKAGRKKGKEESNIDWDELYRVMNIILEEFKAFMPYRVLQVDNTEADDLIAVLAKWSQTNDLDEGMFDDGEPKPFLILSRDSDFIQLQKFKNVKQYSPITKEWKKPTHKKPEYDLMEKIIGGDRGDGICNIFSDPATFVTEGKRQKPVKKDKLAIWITQGPDDFCTDDFIRGNFERNRTLIDFDYIPQEIQTRIINTFEALPQKDRSQMLNYFMSKRLKNMMEVINEF